MQRLGEPVLDLGPEDAANPLQEREAGDAEDLALRAERDAVGAANPVFRGDLLARGVVAAVGEAGVAAREGVSDAVAVGVVQRGDGVADRLAGAVAAGEDDDALLELGGEEGGLLGVGLEVGERGGALTPLLLLQRLQELDLLLTGGLRHL